MMYNMHSISLWLGFKRIRTSFSTLVSQLRVFNKVCNKIFDGLLFLNKIEFILDFSKLILLPKNRNLPKKETNGGITKL